MSLKPATPTSCSLAAAPEGRCNWCGSDLPAKFTTPESYDFDCEWCLHQWRINHEWELAQTNAITRAKGACKVCGSTEDLHVFHIHPPLGWGTIHLPAGITSRTSRCDAAPATTPPPSSTSSSRRTSMSDARGTEAVDTAHAMVSAFLCDDFDSYKAMLPDTPEEAVWVILALAKLATRALESLAEERGREPLELWREVMYATAVARAL